MARTIVIVKPNSCCGDYDGQKLTIFKEVNGDRLYWVQCDICGRVGDGHKVYEEAIEAWDEEIMLTSEDEK